MASGYKLVSTAVGMWESEFLLAGTTKRDKRDCHTVLALQISGYGDDD